MTKALPIKTMDEKYRAPALEKGLDIIELLSDHTHGLTQTQIAKSLGRSPNEIYRMLNALVRRNYIISPLSSERYQLSMKLFTLAHRHPPHRRLIDQAVPLIREATIKSRQSGHIGIHEHGDIIISASVESSENWGLTLRAGSVIGLNNTGLGRVLAAFKSAKAQNRLIDEHILADGEPDMPKSELLKILKKTRERGYECMPSGTTIGVTNLSFPVIGPDGESIAAVTCPYLERIDEKVVPDIDTVISIFSDVAKELSLTYGSNLDELEK